MTSMTWFPFWAQLALTKLHCVNNRGLVKQKPTFSVSPLHVVSSCATGTAPRLQRQVWMAEEDPAEGAVFQWLLQSPTGCLLQTSIIIIYLFILAPVWFRDYEELARWLTVREVRRDSEVFISIKGLWTVCIFLSFFLHLSPSLKPHHI